MIYIIERVNLNLIYIRTSLIKSKINFQNQLNNMRKLYNKRL